jgi:ABC-2 type transport system ATP-binding protein
MTDGFSPDRGGVLELLGLRRRFGPVVALDGLTATVPPGQMFGFLGPNGAGKTTTMRAVLGLVGLDGGEVRWKGAPIGAAARRRFGYMPEERGLYPGMTVTDQLEYLGRLHGMTVSDAATAVLRWTDRVGLGGMRASRIEALSHGNKQRAQLAAALVHDPDLLILDEPFAGLDPVGVATMSEVLGERAADGVTVVLSSHQLDLVEDICQAVAIINRGRLVLEGTVEALARMGPPRLEVRVAGDPTGRWAGMVGNLAQVDSVRDGTVVLRLAGGAGTQAILDAARAAGPVEHFTSQRRRLSEVFRDALTSSAIDTPVPADDDAGIAEAVGEGHP